MGVNTDDRLAVDSLENVSSLDEAAQTSRASLRHLGKETASCCFQRLKKWGWTGSKRKGERQRFIDLCLLFCVCGVEN
jgi:hypothetical protein